MKEKSKTDHKIFSRKKIIIDSDRLKKKKENNNSFMFFSGLLQNVRDNNQCDCNILEEKELQILQNSYEEIEREKEKKILQNSNGEKDKKKEIQTLKNSNKEIKNLIDRICLDKITRNYLHASRYFFDKPLTCVKEEMTYYGYDIHKYHNNIYSEYTDYDNNFTAVPKILHITIQDKKNNNDAVMNYQDFSMRDDEYFDITARIHRTDEKTIKYFKSDHIGRDTEYKCDEMLFSFEIEFENLTCKNIQVKKENINIDMPKIFFEFNGIADFGYIFGTPGKDQFLFSYGKDNFLFSSKEYPLYEIPPHVFLYIRVGQSKYYLPIDFKGY